MSSDDGAKSLIASSQPHNNSNVRNTQQRYYWLQIIRNYWQSCQMMLFVFIQFLMGSLIGFLLFLLLFRYFCDVSLLSCSTINCYQYLPSIRIQQQPQEQPQQQQQFNPFQQLLQLLVSLPPPPELMYTSTFTAQDQLLFIQQQQDNKESTFIVRRNSSNDHHYYHHHHMIPIQCYDKIQHFYHCQQNYIETHVIACHRLWCHSILGGHCEPCAGIGDRTRSLLSQVYDDIMLIHTTTRTGASSTQVSLCPIRIQLDYPLFDLAILDSAVYIDPRGWWAHLFHDRSYSVTNRLSWIQTVPVEIPSTTTSTLSSSNTILPKNEKYRFTHFLPNDYSITNEYDPCYFYALFQPTVSLQKQLHDHNTIISQYPISIGIHYRTGDMTAFNINLMGGDNRVNHIQRGWDSMMLCADALTKRLYPNTTSNDIIYYVATDNALIKNDLLHNPYQNEKHFYTVNIQPNSYLRGLVGDRDAIMELYLLAGRQGLVMNVRQQENYHGPADRLSYFALLAKNIGFYSDHEVMECNI